MPIHVFRIHIMRFSVYICCALMLGACAGHRSRTFQVSVKVGAEYQVVEHEIFDTDFEIPMGRQEDFGFTRTSYDFTFPLSGVEDIKYAYLVIETENVSYPHNRIILNEQPIGYIERHQDISGVNYAGEKGFKRQILKSKTQRYLPPRYFQAGTNILTFKHQKAYSAARKGRVVYEPFTINKVTLVIIKTQVSSEPPGNPLPENSGRDLPEQLQHFSELTDEELYVALIKLPYLLAEISDVNSISSNSLSHIYSRIGDYYRWIGFYKKSLEYHLTALTLQEEEPLTVLTPKIRAGLVLAHGFVGNHFEAVNECYMAMREVQDLKDRQLGKEDSRLSREKLDYLEFLLHSYQALNYYHLENDSEAENYGYHVINNFDDGWGYARGRETEIGQFLPIALAYQTMGDLTLRKAEYRKALEHYQEGLKYFGYERRPEIFHDQKINVELGRAKAFYHLGQHEKASDILEGVEFPTNDFLWRSLLLSGLIAEAQHDQERAAARYIDSIEAIETSRERLTSHGLKINFMADKQEPYARLVDVLISLQRTSDAYRVVEKSKARAFLDLVSRSQNVIGQKNAPLQELTDQERRLQEALLNIQYEEGLKGDGLPGESGMRAIDEAREELSRFIKDSARKDMDFASLRSAETLGLQEIQVLLDETTGLVEYYYGGGKLYAWIIGPDSYRMVQKDISTTDLEEAVKTFRKLVSRSVNGRGITMKSTESDKAQNVPQQFSSANTRLSKLLVDDILSELPFDRVYVVPHGVLHYLPFHALISEGKYLIERYQIGYSPSGSVLHYISEKNRQRGGKMLAMGNPDLGKARLDLPYAATEVKEIKSLFPSGRIYTSGEASEAVFKKEAANFDFLHVASHGEFKPDKPLNSCLRLAAGEGEDGRLEVSEIFNLDLNAYLVTLSACNTAMGVLAHGDELTGLNRAFLFAGTPTILGTLWSVNDKSTYVLMNQFYQNLHSMDKFAALQKAQVAMIRDEHYSHPFYWAPFQVVGDYR